MKSDYIGCSRIDFKHGFTPFQSQSYDVFNTRVSSGGNSTFLLMSLPHRNCNGTVKKWHQSGRTWEGKSFETFRFRYVNVNPIGQAKRSLIKNKLDILIKFYLFFHFPYREPAMSSFLFSSIVTPSGSIEERLSCTDGVFTLGLLRDEVTCRFHKYNLTRSIFIWVDRDEWLRGPSTAD